MAATPALTVGETRCAAGGDDDPPRGTEDRDKEGLLVDVDRRAGDDDVRDRDPQQEGELLSRLSGGDPDL